MLILAVVSMIVSALVFAIEVYHCELEIIPDSFRINLGKFKIVLGSKLLYDSL